MEIDFTISGNSKEFLAGGWSRPESHGTWSDGTDSVLLIPKLKIGVIYQATIILAPFLSPPEVTSQNLLIFVNGVATCAERLTKETCLSFVISLQANDAAAPVEVRLHCATAVSPATVGRSIDERRLGFWVWKITVDEDASSIAEKKLAETVSSIPKIKALKKVAAVTMVYNEAEYLPIWLKHYSAQVGAENCYVIDHGSDDGSTNNLGKFNVIRIPRSPYDPVKQSHFNSEFCSSLLTWFDWVAYSDVDELMIADPSIASDLREYCGRALSPVVTAIGLNIIHRANSEPPLDFQKPILEQRQYVFTSSSMCKPNLISAPIVWSPGSHSSSAPLIFDHLYLFHLRWVDRPYGLRRLQKTRKMAWGRLDGGQHQRVDDQEMLDLFNGFANLTIRENVDFSPILEPVLGFVSLVSSSQKGRENSLFKVDLGIWATNLWKIPRRFTGAF